MIKAILQQQLEIIPLVIGETGSRAWGTNTPLSDHDFTVVGIDKKIDLNTYPRSTHKEKFGHPDAAGNNIISDVQFFSIEKLMRMTTVSSLVAYELVGGGASNLTFMVTPIYERLHKSCLHYFDSREMFRGCIGSLHTLKKQYAEAQGEEKDKRKRQLFRYMFVALQLQLGNAPKLNIHDYIKGPHDFNTNLIVRLHKWAFFDEPEATYELAMRGLFDPQIWIDAPTRQNKEKQHNKFVFANQMLREIHEIIDNAKGAL